MPRSKLWSLAVLAVALWLPPGCGTEDSRAEIPGPQIVESAPQEPVNIGKIEFDSDEFRGMTREDVSKEIAARMTQEALEEKLEFGTDLKTPGRVMMMFASDPEARREGLRHLRELPNESVEAMLRGIEFGSEVPEDEVSLLLDTFSRPGLRVPRRVVRDLAASSSPWSRRRVAAFLATVTPTSTAIEELTWMLTAEKDDSVRATIEVWLARTRTR